MVRAANSADAIAAFSISLSALFLCLAVHRLWSLRQARPVAISGFQGHAKAVLTILLVLSSLGRFVSLGDAILDASNVHIASRALELISALVLSALSWLEHRRSILPSDLIVLYFVACIIRDGFEIPWTIQMQRDWLMQDPIVAQIVLEVALLATESVQKDYLEEPPQEEELSPEERSSILSRNFFWWIHPILYEGYQNVLLGSDLPPIDTKLRAKPTRHAAVQAWDQRLRPENKMTLPKVLLRCLMRPFLLAIPARLFLTIFRYSQPVIIRQAILFVTSNETNSRGWTGHSLVIAAVVVYVGLAISTTAYQDRLNKLRVMARNALVALIHDKVMNSYPETVNEGRVLTLTTTDVDSLDVVGEWFHETWGQVLEVIIGITMLSLEVGWLSPVPLFIIFLCSRVSQYVAKNLRSRQGSWNEATQGRISMTSAAISAIKNVKMLGLQAAMSTRIQELRQDELHRASKVRWMMVAYNASANALGMFAPVTTLVLYAIIAKLKGGGLDAETAFTSIAILSMVTHPANMVMTIVPRVIASFASFERIQSFLLERSRQDDRIDITDLKRVTGSGISENGLDSSNTTVKVEDLRVGETRLALDDINLSIQRGTIVICSGATAAGKTTLARSILSEVPTVGAIGIASNRIGYCSQIPWLPNGSIKEIITGFGDDAIPVNWTWYQTVLAACCLIEDIEALPNGDETIIGSRGTNLSGGQRQRLALARGIFAQTEILILDDPFSALDGRTENEIVSNLLGTDGLLRKLGTTVFLISNATQYFRLADEIIVLEGGRIKERGKWNELTSRDPGILKIIASEDGAHENKVVAADSSSRNPQKSYDDITMNSKRKTGDTTLYSYYIKASGLGNFALMIAFSASCSFFLIFPQYWLKMWTDSGSANEWFFIAGYITFILIAWITTNGIAWSTLIRIAPHSGLTLHSTLLKVVTCAPLMYFYKTDNGSILNRFSQDLELVDRKLAPAIQTVFVQIFKLSVQVVLLFVAQRFLSLTLPVCLVIVYIIQKIYLRTSRQLRLLELESRSAILIDFLETVDGLSTIRAFAGQLKAKAQHLRRLDESHKPFYLLLCLQCWLRIVLDLLVAGIAVGVVALAVVLRHTTTGGQVGVALNMVLVANTTLLKLIESWTNLEISLGAIARIRDLEEEVPGEDQPSETNLSPETWPSSGAVELKNLTASYNPESIVLKGISLKIEQGQKIVICGRTGSGKSSLLLALLKLLDVKSGSIVVDGLNIGFVPRSAIRGQCFVTVPQEPLLLNHQTLRFNVDISETLSNNTIIEALSKVNLWQHFNSIPDRIEIPDKHFSTHPILDRPLASLPPLSVGQGQLLALARALLQAYQISASGARPIILLDEATSSLDTSTEEQILDIVHKEFTENGHTVVMVAHRVGAALSRLRRGRDVVVWMKDGRIEKVGEANDFLDVGQRDTISDDVDED
ncbi:hypothetical protein M426DRAFT_319383 [Hypoxylon sp. CI-4A]|nr:hypothetical protein M426DRAFT_319383 [Hypoxylon sp. CI-4A]